MNCKDLVYMDHDHSVKGNHYHDEHAVYVFESSNDHDVFSTGSSHQELLLHSPADT